MKNKLSYLLIFVAAILLLTCCSQKAKRMNRRLTLSQSDQNPYGLYYAFENLKYIFPDADIQTVDKSPADFNTLTYSSSYNSTTTGRQKRAYIFIANRIVPDQRELAAFSDLIANGQHVFLSAFFFGDSLQSFLKIKINEPTLFLEKDSLTLSVRNPVSADSLSFTYPGFGGTGYLTSLDTQYTTVIGRDEAGHPNFIKMEYKGGGAIYLQTAPQAFTNFFLLHKQNKAYYDNAMSYIPEKLDGVAWVDYYRHAARNKNFSALRFIFSSESLTWAFWLLLALFALIYIFESKRKQRTIPVIEPLRNSSLDFVKTVGRLYYQRHDNANLGQKMAAHFLDYVRTKYNLSTAYINDQFAEKLAFKSGVNRELAIAITNQISLVQVRPTLTDDELLLFNQYIDSFYKQA